MSAVATIARGPLYISIGESRLLMSFLAWIVLGLLAGLIGCKIVNKRGEGVFLDILLGIVGAVIGGWLYDTFGTSGGTGLNLYSLLVAVIGSVALLAVYHAISPYDRA